MLKRFDLYSCESPVTQLVKWISSWFQWYLYDWFCLLKLNCDYYYLSISIRFIFLLFLKGYNKPNWICKDQVHSFEDLYIESLKSCKWIRRRLPGWIPVRSILFLDEPNEFTKEIFIEACVSWINFFFASTFFKLFIL